MMTLPAEDVSFIAAVGQQSRERRELLCWVGAMSGQMHQHRGRCRGGSRSVSSGVYDGVVAAVAATDRCAVVVAGSFQQHILSAGQSSYRQATEECAAAWERK